MGIIEKQATKNVIYSYLGAGLGFVTIMWLSRIGAAENGVIRILVSYAALFSQLANFGFTSVTIRFFPFFKNKDKGHNGFLFYAILIAVIGFIVCWILFLFLKPGIIENNQSKSPLFTAFMFYIMPLTLFTVFFNTFDSYLRACYNSVIGPFTKEFLQRILILIVLTLFSFKFIDFNWFMLLYIISTCLPTIILLFYIIQQKEWHVKPVRGFMSKELRNEMLKLSFFSILTGGASAIIANVDVIMVNALLDEKKTGIYGIAFYFGTIILIPARSLYRIASSVVAEEFKNDNFKEINKLYNKSCNNQLAIGALLFIGILCNINNIMQILPPEFAAGKNVIIIISTGYLVEMATGINQIIIVNSKHYRFDTYFIFFIVGIIIIANYILIPIYGIMGSAMATSLAIIIGNALRYAFLKINYNMQPYDFNTLKLIGISLIAYLPGYFIPPFHNFIIDIAIRSSIVGGLFIILILKTEATPDINSKIRKI